MRILLTIIISLFLSVSIYAQPSSYGDIDRENRHGSHEIRAQISDGLPITFFYTVGFAFLDLTSAFAGYETLNYESQSFGHYGLSYRYDVLDWMSVGLGVSYQRSTINYSLRHSNSGKNRNGNRILNSFLIMPSIEFKYMRKEMVELYGKIDIGMSLFQYSSEVYNEDKTYSSGVVPFYALQINPIGIRIGKKHAGFLEVGAGFQGIITAGYSVKF